MHFVKLFSFIFFITLALHIQQASAECCPCGGELICTAPLNCDRLCYDGASCTPYCGRGSCNIFGCNCDGGCRTKPIPTQSTIPPNPLESAIGEVFGELFKAADLNQDDLLSFQEWANAISQRLVFTESELRARWRQLVGEAKDFLTKAEAELLRM
ncbi:hypothetical protein BD779DRAFT_644943 [Infundibulicybe gibba]|nr:hypothetical protein BD779DRAFT_644943 [Infundibulicybe gibba]